MLWSIQQHRSDFIPVDLLFLAGILTLFLAAFGKPAETQRGPKTLGLGWSLIVVVFLWRFATVLSGDWFDHESAKIIALTRCVLHTLAAPTLLTSVFIVWWAFRDYQAGRVSGLRFGIWIAVAVSPALISGWLVYRFIWPCSLYVGESPFP